MVYQEGGEFHEVILEARDSAKMLDIPVNVGYLIRNTSSDNPAVFVNICDYPWKKDDNETIIPDFSGWQWNAS